MRRVVQAALLAVSMSALNGPVSAGAHEIVIERRGNGNLSALTDAKGNTTTYQYDNMNRLLKTTDRLGKSETYSYYTGPEITPTTGNNLKNYTDKRGQVTLFDGYDAMDRLKHVTFSDGSTIKVSKLPNDGHSYKEILFTEKKITWRHSWFIQGFR